MGEQKTDEHRETIALIQADPTQPQLQPSLIPENIAAGFGRYCDLQFLGQGGMAAVYRAYDPVLGRQVALKFMRAADPVMRERFVVEARAQARIEHPHVCKIYEAGEIDGRPYIAMQFIKGKTLDDAAKELTLEQKLKLMIQISEAIHAAHRAGLIHRDIKPSNMMVEKSEDGQWTPFVTDFGLARDMATERMTITGTAVGTPWYMSPEQAKGEVNSMDRRSDVYSLGAAFYEVITGQLPFASENTLDLLLKVVNEDPVPMRQIQPSIPDDVETIIGKCMQKEPAVRYDSARALAEDLHRYMDGDPILARPTGFAYRTWKRARKHRAIVLISALALLLVLIFSFVGLRARWSAERRAVLAHELGREIKEMEVIMHFAASLPLHDISPHKKLVREKIHKIENDLQRSGFQSAGPSHYALARANIALGDFSKAQQHLESAWKNNYREPEVAYAYGLTLAQLYKDALPEATRTRNKQSREAKERKLEERYLQPALEHLNRARSSNAEVAEHLEALIAFARKDYPLAIRKSREALAKVPWLYEAAKLEGDIYYTIANRERYLSETKAREAFAGARNAYQKSVDIGRSYAAGYLGLCECGVSVVDLSLYSDTEELKKLVDTTVADCEKASSVDKSLARAFSQKSRAYRIWGEQLATLGKDPTETLQSAMTNAEEATKLDPKNADVWNNFALAFRVQAQFENDRGIDPVNSHKKSILNFEKAIAIQPDHGPAFNNLGNSYRDVGEYLMTHNGDPTEYFNSSLKAFQKSIEINPIDSFAFNNLGLTYWDMAEYQLMRGLPYSESYSLATKAFQDALKLYPEYTFALSNQCGLYVNQAMAESGEGKDPRKSIESAVDFCERCSKINPNFPHAHLNKGIAWLVLAKYEAASGGNPSSSLSKALKGFQDTEKLQSGSTIHYEFAGVALVDAKYKLGKGEPVDAALRDGYKAIRKAIEINPSSSQNYLRLAELQSIEMKSKHSPQLVSQCESNLRKAVEIDPKDSNAWRIFAQLRNAQAQVAEGVTAETLLKDAIDFANRAIQENPRNAKAYLVRANILEAKSKSPRFADQRTQLIAAAKNDAATAAKLNPLAAASD